MNLRHLQPAELAPGHAIVAPDLLAAGRWLDAELNLLRSAPRAIATGERVRLFVGTIEAAARLRLLDRDSLQPGESALVQLHCLDELTIPARERFILRQESPTRTIGGGRILVAPAQRRRRKDVAVLAALQSLARAEAREVIRQRLSESGYRGCGIADLARLVGCAPAHVAGWARESGAEIIERVAIDGSALALLRQRIRAQLDDFHRRHPREPGMPREQLLLIAAHELDQNIFQRLVAELSATGELVQEQGMVRRPQAGAQPLSARDLRLAGEVERIFRQAGLTPPDVKEVIGGDPHRQWAVRHLLRRGILVRTVDRVQRREILFHCAAIAEAKRLLPEHFAASGGFSASAAGRALRISRKYSIPLLEYLDAAGFTRREGDQRRVAAPAGTATPGAGACSLEAAIAQRRR